MSEVVRSKLSDKGRIVIPALLRQQLGIKPGDVLFLEVVDNELKVSTFEGRLARTRARMQKYAADGRSWADELIADRREEVRREEEEHASRLENRPRG